MEDLPYLIIITILLILFIVAILDGHSAKSRLKELQRQGKK